MISTYSFKGKDLFPFSAGRRDVAMSLGLRCFSGAKPTIMDMHTILFICTCPAGKLSKACLNPDGFFEDVLKWVDDNISVEDYETEASLVAQILTNAFKHQAVPKPSDLPEGMDDDPN